jgi:predicted nucleic acid-binding Zn ribbon protein
LADEPEPRRSRRDSLLLELGALVYELHRRGRRAPELLQEKAAELDALDQGEVEAGAPRPCPACGQATEPDQLVCLNCGQSLGLDREQQPKSRAGALAALVAVVVIGAGAAGFALSELTNGSDDDRSAVAERAAQPQAPEPEAQPEPELAPEPAPEAEGTPQPPRQSLLLEWPEDLRGHTVVLVNTSDRVAARRVARDAARSGIETGLLRSDDYDLGTGLWIVFAGRFDTRRGAERQAVNLGERYPGAYVQLVEPRSQ